MSVGEPRSDLPPSFALAAYASALLRGRRVAVFGDCDSGLGAQVATLSERQVHVYDPVRTRVAAAIARAGAPGAPVHYAPLDAAPDGVEGAFDVVLIADLDADAAASWFDLARRLTSPRGLVMVASPHASQPSALDYYQLYDALAERFQHVRMLGQAPFVGFTVAEFALEGEPSVTIDASLMNQTEEPRFFVAVASDVEVTALDPYTLIQVPFARAGSALAPTTRPPDARTATELSEARVRVSVLELELEKAQERAREAERRGQEREAAATVMSTRLAELQAAAEEKEAGLRRKLESAETEAEAKAHLAEEERRRLSQARADLERARARAERAERALDEREEATHQRRLGLEEKIAGLRREQKREREAAKAAEDRNAARIEALERDLSRTLSSTADARRDELAQARREAERAAKQRWEAELERTSEAQQKDLDDMLERIAELEAELEDAHRSTPAEDEKLDVRGLTFQRDELKGSLRRARAEIEDLQRRVDDAERARDALEAERRRALTATSTEHDEGYAALDEAERRLLRQARRQRRLEADLREGERLGRELLRQLERSSSPNPGELEALRQRVARSDADLQAARWTIAKLEERLPADGAPAASSEASPTRMLEEALRGAQAEIATLRQSLAEGREPA
ncbi:MAG: hypothetical protein AAGN82_27985 [Myxococcota bacterium]